ncbi:MAG: DUF2726 domain-containing protein [Chloroflexota bacterium]
MTEPSAVRMGARDAATLPYRLRENFLTAGEIGLYRALSDMTKGRYVIFTKVALNEIFLIVRPNENVHYFNKLFRKYVDFLLCSPETLKPHAGVELVRASPQGGVRDADQFMEDLFLGAGLPLVQIRAADRFAIPDLLTSFQQAFARVKQGEGRAAGISQDSVPMCPVCGKMMVLRTQRGGRAEGRLFYGCIDNPTCPGRVAVR